MIYESDTRLGVSISQDGSLSFGATGYVKQPANIRF